MAYSPPNGVQTITTTTHFTVFANADRWSWIMRNSDEMIMQRFGGDPNGTTATARANAMETAGEGF